MLSRRSGKDEAQTDLNTLLLRLGIDSDCFENRKKRTDPFQEAWTFICHIAERPTVSGNGILKKAGRSYREWTAEIANGTARNQTGRRYTNSIGESDSNHLKTIIKTAYGYRNFERFRKRAQIIE